ncbi:MAG: type 1 glutamine amidotransferase, partial [Candidatus Firestonebacteria bacterium]|nr:type 1 glutamine amidotransferase [Candidatus Firestonebacteria bacterium]
LAAIILGGPMNVSDQDHLPHLKAELEFIRGLLAAEIPILGVCLGAQMLAAAMGAQVGPGPHPEIGYMDVTLTPVGAEDTLLSGFPMALPVFQWHAQGFDLPPRAELLATSEAFPNQAFRSGKAWGFQFHLEVTPAMVRQWAQDSQAELSRAGVSETRLAEQSNAQAQMVSLYGRRVIRRFWDSLAEI